jgi:hypothetical protein
VLDRKTLDRWYSDDPIENVHYRLNDAVALRERTDELASVISLEELTPEPRYLVELSSGRDLVAGQSELAKVIYVALLDVDVWRPVAAEPLDAGRFHILSETPSDEKWQFRSGTVVICEKLELEGHPELVAVAVDAA